MINIRDFKDTERQEISRYILNNVPFSILQKLFPLTENPSEKPEVYTICYRILNTAKNLVSADEAKNKLNELLDDNKDIYILLYNLLLKSKKQQIYGSHIIRNKIFSVISKEENLFKINNLIDVFLILAEKHELIDLDKVIGLDLETDEGKDIYKELSFGE